MYNSNTYLVLKFFKDFIIQWPFDNSASYSRNSIPPTTTVKNLNTKADSAKDNVYVDVGFWGGVIPGNQVKK